MMKFLTEAVFAVTVAAAAASAVTSPAIKVYPKADPPQAPPAHLSKKVDGVCPTCPWQDPNHGPYPNPFNAPASYEPTHRGKYFDVYGHWIETHYSEALDSAACRSLP